MSEPPRPPMGSGYNPYGDAESSGQWDQTQQWPSQQDPPKKKRSKLVPLLLGAMVLAAVATGGGLYLTGAFSTEIRTEAVAYNDADAFTASVGNGVELASLNTPAAPVVPQNATDQPVLVGNKPGLYGGTGDNKTCDKGQLVAFLAQNPTKAAAWAQVQGIQVSQISAFVATLTPLLLRADTAVVNHGFKGGVANPINSVLQAGTAVLVDNRGVPRARCLCGNPLLEGKQFTRTKYTGTAWTGFQPARVAKVQPAPQAITTFDVINIYTGQNYQQIVDNSINVAGSVTPATTPAATTNPATSVAATNPVATNPTTRAPVRTTVRTPPRTTAPAPVQPPAATTQAPVTTQAPAPSNPETCTYTDAGNGSPIVVKEGSTFTDSLGNTYRVPKGCGALGGPI